MNKVHIVILAMACGMGTQAKAATIAITYSFAGAPTGPPVISGTTATIKAMQPVLFFRVTRLSTLLGIPLRTTTIP
ncbi:MAG: hypothetical protein ACR2I2_01885 [Bryobacteraceae bacterium]